MPDRNPVIFGDVITEKEAEDLAAMFKVVAEPSRLQILSLVRDQPGTYMQAMRSRLPISQPSASHHVTLLREVGLLHGDRVSGVLHLKVAPDALAALADRLRAVVGRG